MEIRTFPSKYLEKAVNQFAKLPGVGYKTAFRFVLHMLKQDEAFIKEFTASINDLQENIIFCNVCNNFSDSPICSVCSKADRHNGQICVVESFKEVMAIENTGQFKGLYHVLGGVISPVDGIGPSELNINSLITRIENEDINEIILAISPTMEGETTMLFLYRKLSKFNLNITTLSKGVAIGDQLEYADEITLGQSILNRTKLKVDF